MGCSATNVCNTCFNFASGKVGAKSLASNTCTAALTRTITDAKFYSGTLTNTGNFNHFSAGCKSNSKKYLYVDYTAAAPYTAYCQLCKKGKGGNATYTACTGTAITNCDYAVGTGCGVCKSKYAVASTGTTCTSFTSDGNC